MAENIPGLFSEARATIVGYVTDDGDILITIAHDNKLLSDGRVRQKDFAVRQKDFAKVVRAIEKHAKIDHSSLLSRLSYCMDATEVRAIVGHLTEQGIVRELTEGAKRCYEWAGKAPAPDDSLVYRPLPSPNHDQGIDANVLRRLSSEELDLQRAAPLWLPNGNYWVYRSFCVAVEAAGCPGSQRISLRVMEAVLEFEVEHVSKMARLERKVQGLQRSLLGDSDEEPDPDGYVRVRRRLEIFSTVRGRWLPMTPEEEVRQGFVAVLVNDYGYRLSHIAEEEQVAGPGSGQARADLVVWRSEEDKAEGKNPLIIVECKSPDVPLSSGVCYQGENYARMTGARFLVATNGGDAKYWRIMHDRMPKTLEEIEDIPSAGSYHSTNGQVSQERE